jgi:cytochrome c oxidase subunit 4
MSEPQTTHHGEVSTRIYLIVFGLLLAFTAVSFAANEAVRHNLISPFASFVVILSVAVCKAVLVGVFFMHLLFDWRRVFMLIVPGLMLGVLLVLVLLPDMVLSWTKVVDP